LQSKFEKLVDFSLREDNAFVRVSISLGQKSLAEAREIALEFIRSFYPAFLDYVKEE